VEWVSVMTAAALKMDSIDEGTNSDELPPGTRLLLGQFTIESFVNSGGFGIVYIARDSLSRRVVVKECFPSSFCRRIGTSVGARSRAQQEDFRSVVKLFLQEAITLSQLDHPNIVKVHQVFEDNSTAYIAMEFVDGPDLLQTVEGTAPALKPDEIVRFLDKMLDAVGYVHAQGLLHRDISPDNILLDKATGQPVLIDFGASRKDVTRQSRALSGLRVVKDGYSPQEFYVSGSKQAPCSDLYALAATFYHLISGESPKTSQERLSAIAGREPDPLPRLSGRIKGYPAGFLAAIDKAMALFPRDRLQSVDDWRAMMHADPALPALAARPSKQSAPSPQPPPPLDVGCAIC
jgi:serine/threonine protein kinase